MKPSLFSFCFFALLVASLLASPTTQAQTLTSRYASMIQNSKAYLEYLPEGYSTSEQTYPLLLCLHGVGSLGDGSPTSLGKVAGSGVPRQLRSGSFPTSFTVNGHTYQYLIIAPQFVDWPSPTDINGILDYIVGHYRIDQSRIYITGYSMGGGAAWAFTGDNSTYAKRVAAIVPVCGANYPDMTRARTIAGANVAVWATHNDGDPTVQVSYTNTYVKNINLAPAPTPMAKKTIFHSTLHDAWSKTYDPSFTEEGLNIYEWLLQFKREGVDPSPIVSNQAPKADAGADQTIALPLASITLSGKASDGDGTIASYSWSKVSGPSACTFSSAATASPKVSGLVEGSYTFSLSVKDNDGATASDRVIVTVKRANQAPVVTAGESQQLTLPLASITLSGKASDGDGTIASYKWSKVSGPSVCTFSAAGSAITTASGLVEGSYTFCLKATDNAGASSQDTTTVVVSPAASGSGRSEVTRYIKVNVYGGSNAYANSEWNNWNVGTTEGTGLFSGPLAYSNGTASTITAALSHSQAVGDNGQGYSSGVATKMAPAEVLRYTSYSARSRTVTLKGLSASRKYSLELYSSRYSIGNSTVYTLNGATQTIYVYDNYQSKGSYTNITPNAQGEVVITLQPGTNYSHFNGFVLTEQGTDYAAAVAVQSKGAAVAEEKEATGAAGEGSLGIYPNAVQQWGEVRLSSGYQGKVQAELVDAQGRVVKSYSWEKSEKVLSRRLELGGLARGTYVLRVGMGNNVQSQKLLKL